MGVRRDGRAGRGEYVENDVLVKHPDRPHLLFIGEAPGDLEDVMGKPFIGTSGRIVNFILTHCTYPFTYTLTYTVCCRPSTFLWDGVSDGPSNYKEILKADPEHYDWYDFGREPTTQEKEACRPHIVELIESTRPTGIVFLGKVAQEPTRLPHLNLHHPGFIARMEYKLIETKKQIRLLSEFVERLTCVST